MIVIGEAIVEDDITREYFSCDLAECHGACCTLQGCRGAPLVDHETTLLNSLYPIVRKYIPDRHRRVADLMGVFEGQPGDYATTSVEQRECVFVFFENDIARCALEKAFLEGETTWRKPVSCHLFPIRISGGQQSRLRYEQIKECKPARADGRSRRIVVGEFLEDPLTRVYGQEWFGRLHEEITRMVDSSRH